MLCLVFSTGEDEQNVNGDALDLAYEKYMFTDEDEDGGTM